MVLYSEHDDIQNAKKIVLHPGDNFHVYTGLRHQMIALEDTELFDIHSYHLGFSDAYVHRVDPSIGMGKCLRPTLCLFVCDAFYLGTHNTS